MSGVFSSWLTESRNARSASREAASCSTIWLNASASDASSVVPSACERLVALVGGERARRRRDALQRPHDRPCKQEREHSGERDSRERCEQQVDEERTPRSGLDRRRPQDEQAESRDRRYEYSCSLPL